MTLPGSLNGELNGVRFNDHDLNFYMPGDGRSYMAISQIPPSLGWHMQGLVPVSNMISWMFALPKEGAVNGFSLTGGVLNYTAEVSYPGSGDSVMIQFVFNRMDDYLTANATISGTVPSIPKGAQIRVEDHSRVYSQWVGISHPLPGSISAESRHSYQVYQGSASPPVVYSVKETIAFGWDGCLEESEVMMWRHHASRNFIIYEEQERTVRYAVQGSMSPLEGETRYYEREKFWSLAGVCLDSKNCPFSLSCCEIWMYSIQHNIKSMSNFRRGAE